MISIKKVLLWLSILLNIVLLSVGIMWYQDQRAAVDRELLEYQAAVYYLKSGVNELETGDQRGQQQKLQHSINAERNLTVSLEKFLDVSRNLGDIHQVNMSVLHSIINDTKLSVQAEVNEMVQGNTVGDETSKLTIETMLPKVRQLVTVLPPDAFPTEEEASKINKTLQEIRFFK